MATQTERHLLYISSREIENAVATQARLWVPRSWETELADLVHLSGTTMVGAYYELCFQTEGVPTQQQHIDFYLSANKPETDSMPSPQLEAMKARCARAYNSFVMEHQLMAMAVESGKFDTCYKSEALDVSGEADLVIRLGDKHYGFSLRLKTPSAKYWVGIKKQRQARRGQLCQWPIIPIDADFGEMRPVSGIHLFTSNYGVNLLETHLRQFTMAFTGASK